MWMNLKIITLSNNARQKGIHSIGIHLYESVENVT